MVKAEFSLGEARRIALTAQGFNSLHRDGAADAAGLRRSIARLGLLQIDSVNVLVRAHYMPLYSRLGAYDRSLLDAVICSKAKRLFEYWGHEASLLPLDVHPLLRWRMERARQGIGVWKQLEPFAGSRRGEADAMLDRIRSDGPQAASDLAGSKVSKGMWAWSDAKHALEWLFWAGLITSTHRRGSFERVYDLPERVLPAAIQAQATPTARDAQRNLLARSAKALGIATAEDLRDYYRIPAADVAAPIQDLVEDGTLAIVRVKGWKQQAYLHRDASAGRKTDGATLLSPFDPLIWHRPRTLRLFGFHYRLEIYTPAHKREHGYYVLPFLMDGQIVARVDLKADRKSGILIVQRAHLEPDPPRDTARRLREELDLMASWLGLSDIRIEPQAAAALTVQ
ncbi:hypothetical protein SAMN05428989_1961 [Pseudoxanthomonas sp. GM95]|uniref:winged helix-turn-helix domain-containing protein n=1 Tax=Pseudoxanthomonas sp. GM95 TaxID=1881043 RepID=UPI0008AE0CF7|nr:crosslink repair DNA glycosylase YcaQ family protein [Pseudoxanthomonas sp. GM95]SEL57427.1 hypothetical protein SAMN05428989_1961 [Pseudoxanthomonas sp. GM95]